MAPRMVEDDPDSRRLAQLKERLEKARGDKKDVPQEKRPQSQFGIAFRLVTELLAAVIVGGLIGWALDRIFATSPVLLIAMFLLGVAAGMRNVVRTARQMNEMDGNRRR
jgi:ATP synthase protein I